MAPFWGSVEEDANSSRTVVGMASNTHLDRMSGLSNAPDFQNAGESSTNLDRSASAYTPDLEKGSRHDPEKKSKESPSDSDNEKDWKKQSTTPDAARPDHVPAINNTRISLHKYAIIGFVVALNFMFIFASHWWSKYYYIYLPFIALQLALNCLQIFSIGFFWALYRRFIKKEKPVIPDTLENLVYLLPCYNETLEELQTSMDSLVAQTQIDGHKKAIFIVCDGRVKGQGMPKTTAAHLLEDVLHTTSQPVKSAYVAWDRTLMDVQVAEGTYAGIPVFCIIKDQNRGKRDSLIVARSFMYNFNIRAKAPRVIFSPAFFTRLTKFFTGAADMDRVDYLVGMDADTRFDEDCTRHLIDSVRFPNVAGVCGYVAVDFNRSKNYSPASVYQHAEYTIAQGLRRLHQSIATRKVSCLPGCCQLLVIQHETCGDEVLVDKFGYYPSGKDGIFKFTRATASEDRNHVCLMLTTYPKVQTRQCIKARAYTDVPNTWSVFLSQRRRWTLGATSNDVLLFLARKTHWWERIVAFSNVLAWVLNMFILASIYAMVRAFMQVPWFIILAFASVMIIPYLWYFGITFVIPRNFRERMQYLAGLLIFTVCGPFINIAVQLYAFIYMDAFGWGKTRIVVSEDNNTGHVSSLTLVEQVAANGIPLNTAAGSRAPGSPLAEGKTSEELEDPALVQDGAMVVEKNDKNIRWFQAPAL